MTGGFMATRGVLVAVIVDALANRSRQARPTAWRKDRRWTSQEAWRTRASGQASRFVLTNAADRRRTDEYSAWYDGYEEAIIVPGLIANAFRFANPSADGTETDPTYAAIYDIVAPDPASAWPEIENSPGYPGHLFDDPRSKLVAPALRASYALTGWLEADTVHGPLTGVHIILSDGGTDAVRERRAAALLMTAASTGRRDSKSSKAFPSRPNGSRCSRPICRTR